MARQTRSEWAANAALADTPRPRHPRPYQKAPPRWPLSRVARWAGVVLVLVLLAPEVARMV